MVFLIVSWNDSSPPAVDGLDADATGAFAGRGCGGRELVDAVAAVGSAASPPRAAAPPSSFNMLSKCACMSGEDSSSPISSAMPAWSCLAKSSSSARGSAEGSWAGIDGLPGLERVLGSGFAWEGLNSSSMSGGVSISYDS